MKAWPLWLTLFLAGLILMTGEARANLFTDVTAATLGNTAHTGASGGDVRIGTGAVWFDYDRDGDLDLYMTNRVGPNRLWRNDGHGVFVEVAAALGVADSAHDGSGVSAADYDNDGDLDLYLANSNGDVLFKNQLVETGSPMFIDVTASAFPGITTPQRGTSASWGDYDNDGYLDLYVTNHVELPGTTDGSQDRLFHNNGDGTFTDVSSLLLAGDANGDGADDNLGGDGFIASWTDYDGDGDLDIFLINDCPYGPVGTKLFRNDGGTNPLAWNFTEVSASVGAADCRNGMGIAVGDYDRDGWLDYFYTNITSPLLLHNGGGTFADMTAAAGLDDSIVPATGKKRITWGTIFFDYDLDGFVDLCVAAGSLTPVGVNNDPQPNLLYHNDGNGVSFTDVSSGSGIDDTGRGRTIIMGDYDGDGDPDLFLVNYGDRGILFRNDYANTTGHHWLILDLQGAGPPLSNRDGIGAKIKVTTPDGAVQYWETRSGDSLGGGSDLGAYFGLNNNTLLSQLEVTWPDGTVQTISNLAVDQRLTIEEEATLPPEVTVISPNGKETWVKGTTHSITWTDNFSGNVKIRLLSGRTTVSVIAASTPSDGSFDWTVPASLADG
ncbi:MAG TPA: FG-GAP-like repeat-containing protein, partial [Chthoniobacterales bacterium]